MRLQSFFGRVEPKMIHCDTVHPATWYHGWGAQDALQSISLCTLGLLCIAYYILLPLPTTNDKSYQYNGDFGFLLAFCHVAIAAPASIKTPPNSCNS